MDTTSEEEYSAAYDVPMVVATGFSVFPDLSSFSRESAFSFLLSSSLSAMIFLESPGEYFSLSLIDKFDRVVDMLVEGDGMVTSFDENVIENVGSPEPGFLSPFGVW
ncbi:hypothetical protein AgCh_028582 [Apium graveolens]